jgi:hypothetical protein
MEADHAPESQDCAWITDKPEVARVNCCYQAISLLTLAGIGGLIRQLDSIRVFPFPFVLFGKNLF